MTSPRARPVLLALLGILAIAVAAATLNSAVAVDDDVGFGSGDGLGTGSGSPVGPNGSSTTPGLAEGSGGMVSISAPCLPFLTDPRFLLAAGAVALVGGFLLYRWKGLLVPVGVAAAALPPVMLVYAIFTACGGPGESEEAFPMAGQTNESSFDLFAGNASGGGATGGLSAPSILLLVGLGVALVAAVALLFVTSDDQLLDDSDEPEPAPEPAPEAIGRAAGRAADRIEEDAELENEVFRAWHEMTTYLDVPNPEASSPGEFADAAVDAGMAREDVTRLTRLFEDVRYGAAEATADREQRAVDALRRIESQYAEDEA